MPAKKKRNPQTFDEHLAAVVDARITKRGRRYEDVSAYAAIPVSNFSRRMRGMVPFTAGEIARIGAYLEFDPAEMLEEALRDFGGMSKLLSEVRHNNEPSESLPIDDADPFDNVTQLSRAESLEVNPERKAAHRRRKDQGE